MIRQNNDIRFVIILVFRKPLSALLVTKGTESFHPKPSSPLPESESYESDRCVQSQICPDCIDYYYIILYYLRFYNYIMKKQVVLVSILLAAIITSIVGLEQQ
ncbi:MAG TPA: hypothetical protein VI278_16615, partial [Nitrososphaeraceae archaeon]